MAATCGDGSYCLDCAGADCPGGCDDCPVSGHDFVNLYDQEAIWSE